VNQGPVAFALTGVELTGGLAALFVVLVAGVGIGALVERRRSARRVTAALARSGFEVLDAPRDTVQAVGLVERALSDRTRALLQADSTGDLLRAAFEGIPQGVVVVDGRGEVVERNSAAEAFVAARHADALVEAAVAELVDEALDGRAGQRVLELYGPPWRVVVVDVAPLAATDGNAVVVIIDDVTERRRLEAVRKDFVANISHELKTPVGAIGLLAETLLGEDDPEVVARLAGRIQTEALRVGHTIEDLLELSRIETTGMTPGETFAVSDVVAEAVRRIQPAAEQAGIVLDPSGVDQDVELRGDRRQLTSAVSNLLDNAVKYSDAGSAVEVAARLGDDGRLSVSVTDRGIGIPARDLERIFERFYRVDQGRSRDTGGTGLGLAIVRHVAANHEGTVEVESRLGVGSTFSLHLPAHLILHPTTHSTTPAQEPAR
jgi:two-component system, OmpR family, sensor histidine kinase SenX3